MRVLRVKVAKRAWTRGRWLDVYACAGALGA
jgi:hypothetical protein